MRREKGQGKKGGKGRQRFDRSACLWEGKGEDKRERKKGRS